MKFRDIPKFTRAPCYHTNVEMYRIKNVIEDYKQNYHLNMNPDFQRGHVWTKEQQIAYVEYLLKGGASGKDFYFNSSDWMQGEFKAEMVIMDGLQRITAIIAFIDNEIPAFGLYHNQYEDRMRMADVYLNININDLKTRKEVLKWYIEMNTGGTPHNSEEINRVKKLLEEEK